ncbi:YadA-like family protein [Actinobacillus pleuropneumoniae]|uniref:YadA-like family protein n=1 Tax=Actinobacillus pleuropneumoniae TaxID=715 RepID=UPI003F7B6DA4
MNKIFKVIWSHVTQTFVVVSELTRSKSKAKASVSDVKMNDVPSLITSGFKLTLISSLLISSIPTVYAAVAIDSMNRGFAFNNGTAKAGTNSAHYSYNYENPGNKNYVGQSDTSRYSGTLEASSGIAIGLNATTIASDNYSSGVAIGDNAMATGGLSFALGAYTQATAIGSTVIGTAGLASGFNSLAMMRQSAATNNYAMAIGTASWADGVASLAMGSSATARGKQSIAIGSSDMLAQNGGNGRALTKYDGTNNTQASGVRAIAIGTTARTSADDTIAIGTKTRILEKESGSIAIGNTAGTQGIKDTRADYLGYTPITIKDKVGNQQDKIAIGTNSYADGHDSIAIGTRAQAIFTNNALSIGTSRNTENAGAVSIGYQSIAQGDQAVALGSRAEALNRQAMALGNDAFASGVGSIVIGGDDSLPHGSADTAGYQLTTGYNPNSAKFRPSAATGNGAVVVGVHSQALSQGSTAIGVAATAGDNDEVKTKDTVKTATAAKEATAVGAKSRAKSEHTTAVGYEAKAFGLNSTTVGAESTAESTNSFAGGYKATANGTNATAIGSSAQTKGDDAIAIGTGAKALNTNTISIGTGNTVTGANSTAIGDPTTISGTGSHSLGNDNIIPDDNSTVIGNSNVLSKGDWSSTSDGSHVVGNNVQIRGENSLAFGNNAMVGDANNEGVSGSVNATAIGTSATAKGANALAVGTGAKASKTNNTAIGTSATVTKDAGEDNIAFGSGATVTRGKNNVVIGKGSQADSLNGSSIAIGDGATIGNGVTGNGYAIGTGANIASTNGGIAFGNGAKITNSNGGDGSSVAIGEGAVATGTRAISLGHKANTDGNQVDSIAIGSSAKTSGNNNIAIGNNATAQGNQAEQIVIGTGANASGTSQYSIVMGSGAGATREHSTVLGSKANSIVDGGVALGANSVSDRQDGGSATGHRSTYEPYIPGTADPAQIEAINKTKGTTGAVSVGASATSSSPAILRQITNLAAGAEDTDAVNVAQLKAAVTTAVASSSWNIKENSTQKDVVNSGDNVSFANGTGTTATVEVTDSDKTSTVKYSVNKSNLNVATDGTVTAANTGDNFATADQVAQAINKSEKTTAINNSTTITAKPTTVGTVTTYDLDLTQETKDKIQQGIDANTTVNTKGITFTADNAGAKTERKLGETLAINGDKTLINTTVEAGKVSIAATDKLKTAVTNAESALQEIVTTVNGTTAQTVNKNSNKANFINGKNIELTPSKDGITVATKENVDFTTVNATTVNATTVNGNTIKSGNVVINQDGINAGGQTITNVKAGDKGTDAVNLNQLNEVKNTANAGWNLQANGQNGSNVKPNETVSLNNTDNNIVISKDANNDNVTFGLNSTLNIGNTKPIKIDGTTGTISGLVSTLPTSSTLTAQTKPTTTDAILSSAATVGDVLNSGWNLQGNSQAVDFVSAYDTVNFVSGSGTTAEVTVDAGKAASTVKYSVNKSDLTVAPNGTVTASNKGDNFATADQVAKAINDSEKTSSVVSSTKTIKVTSKVDGKNTEYDLDLSEATKTSLQNADNALQSWTAQANGQAVKTVSKDNATLNFVNGTNIQVTNDNGQVKIATVDAPTFTTVTAGTVNAENFTTGTVSITDNGINAGNQKITNLANGTANSDAVTLAQLNASKSVVQAGNNTHVRSETVTDGSTVYTVDANATTVSGSNALNITKSDAGNNVTNYALDLSDKTKGEIKQGVDANTTVNTKGLTFTADSGTDTLRKLGETLAINGDATLINTKVEAGKVSVVATKTLTDAVTNATSALQSIVTTADSKDAQTVNKDSNKANFISGTNIQLTGTKEGITVATKESVDFTTVNATTVNATTVNGDTIKSGDVVITKDGINAGNQTISNVKDGTISENSKEAVNGSQLYTTNQNVTNNTANITKNATDIAKGTVYAGDVGNSFTRPLGETTNVKGGATDNLSDNNIGVVSDGKDTLTVKLAKTLTDLTSAEFGEKDSSDKTVINKDGVSSEVIGKDGNVINSTDLTSDGVTSESVIPETQTSSTETADDGTTTQTDTATDGLDSNEVSSQGMTVSTSTTEVKTTTVTPKDGTTGPKITTVETDTVKTTGVDNDGIRINTTKIVTTTTPDGPTTVVENGEVSLTSGGLNNGGNRAINIAAGVNATDAVNVSQLEAAKTHYYSVKTTTEQANFNNDTATGENSIAAGPNVWAQGVQSAVFGSMAGASSDKATAVGNDAWALGVQSTAIGSGVVAGGKGSVVIGSAENTEKTVSTAEAENSVAIGTHAVVTKADAVAIGHNSGAVNVNTTAIGSGANASGEHSTALGNKASSSGNNATALGVEANASGQESNVLGYKANSNGYRAMALGTLSNAAGTMAIALGSQSNASGIKAQAFGSNAIASAEDAIAMGSNANANAVSGVALGNRSMASGVSGVALGDGAASNAQQSISIGKSARTTATNSIALGNASLATADSAIAMGNSSSAVGSNGIAVGAKSKALKDNAIALGNNATVTANNALALGLNSVAYSDNAIVLGTTSKATGSHAVAIGTGASAYRQNSIAMGKDSSTGGDFAVALGDSANAAAENTLALGKNAVADKKDSVALGNNAYTGDVIATESATLAGQVYEFAGKAPIGTVSVGNQGNERTITNVAAGRISSTSTDAINGSQLYAVSEVASRGWNIQANGDTASQVAPGATVQFIDGTNIDITRDGNNITIATATNVVTTDTDKYVTGGTVVYNDKGEATATLTGNNGAGGAITGVKNNFVTKSETATDGKKATLTRNDGGTVDIDLTNTVNQAVTEATDKGTKYAGDKADTGAAANEFGRKLGETTNVKGGAQGELSDNNIGVVSNGVDTLTVKLAKALSGLTSATFGSDATDQTVINKDGVTINSTTPDKTVSLTETGLNNGGNKITNVAEGKAGTDAVNVDQLTKAITDSAYNWNISDGTNNTAVPDSGTVAVKGSANADSANTVGVVTELEGTDVKVDLSQKAKEDIANGQKHSSVNGDTNVLVEVNKTPNAEGGKQYDVKLADTVVVGKDKPVTIDGTNGTVSGLTNTTWDPDTKYEGGKAATQEQLKSVSDVAQKGWNIQANKDTATKVAPGDTVKFIDGENIKVTRAGNEITIATAKDVKFDSVKVGDKVTINNDSINAGDTKVTNVTNGTLAADSKDAVNGSQLYATNQNVTNNAANITKNADNIAKGTVYAGDRLDAAVTGKTNNFTRALGEQTNVVGGATGELSDNNLAVISNGTDTLTVKLAKSLTDLTNATFGSTDMDKTVINKDGVTISSDKSEKTVSLTDKGLNNGNNQITNVTSGLVKRDGNPVELSKAEGDVLTNAVNVGDLKTTVTNLTEEGKGGGFGLTAEDNKDVKADLGKTVKVQGDGSVKTTVVEKDGQSALQVGLTENVTVGGQDKPGTITVKGENGKDGVSINGKDGSIGLTGAPGKDGQDAQATIKVVDGTKGLDGNNGKDGESKTRIVYEKPNGDKEQVATLNDGLNFVGDKGQVIQKKLNETLAIKGNLDANATVTDKNLRVDNDKDQNGELIIKMAKSLTDLTNATFSSGDINATIGGNGLTITPKGGDVVSLTDKGLNNGNNTITNVAPGVNGTDAVNKGQLDGVNATANAGWNLTTNGDNTNASNVAPNSTVDLANTDGNIVITKAGNNVTFDLNNNLTVGGPGKDGKDGVDGQLGVQGKDGKTGVTLNGKDGAIGINGKDGSNGAITVKQGKPGVNGTDGETKTRFVYELKDKDGKPVTYENGTTIVEELATLNDGLNFIGDKGQVIHKKLNDTLAIKGNLTATAAVTDKNLRVDNENGQLIVKMAKSLTDLTNATFGSDNSNTTIGGNGVTITPNGGDAGNTVSLTDKGLNNGNNQVANVSTGLKGRDGNNVTLENASGDVLNNAVNVGDLKDSVHNLTNATTGGFGLMDEKGKDVKADLGKTVTVKGDGSVKTTVVEVEKDGKKEKFLEVGLTNNVTVGNDKEPGTITVKGENGKDGVSISGKDGIGIKGENGQDAVSINGKDGDGTVAVKGKDGKTGVALNGKDGTIGINGKDGSNGSITVAQGTKGLAGNDGKDGKTKTRIVYNTTTPDGKPVTEEVATLNDGLNFVGNDGKAIAKKLNETLAIKGNLSTAVKEVTANNLRVDNVGDELIINMAKALTDLTSATFTNVGGDKSVVTGNGLTITPTKGGNKVSLTTTGLNNGGNKVINVAAGDVNANSTDAVNGSQLYAVSEVANKGWNIQTNGNDTTNVKPGDTVNFVNGDNIAITNDGTKVTVGLVKNVDLGEDGSIKAGDTFVNKDGVKVGDNVSLTKDGLTAGDVKISATTGINAGDKQITNVASGLGGKKLSEAEGDTLTNAANIGDLQTAVSSVTDASQGGGFGLADDKGANVTQNLGKTIAVKGDGKNISTVVKGGALTVNLNKDVDLGKDGSVTTGNTKVSDKGVSFADSLVNLTSNGLDNGSNKVTNVKAGDVNANSTDAVNGSQLYATNQNVTNVQNEVAKGWNIEAGEVDGGRVFNASKTKVAMGNTVGVKAGKNIEITQNSTKDGPNIEIATSANPTFETVTTESVKVGKGDNTVAIETVTDKHGSALKVSGADGKSETRINNVADGKADNDAVNVRQLRGVAQNVANIDNRVSKLDKRVRGIGANSAAASSLPQVYIPGKSMVALAGGAYSGASAVAVGYSRASDNGKVILKVNGTANSAGHYSGGVGVGYQW